MQNLSSESNMINFVEKIYVILYIFSNKLDDFNYFKVDDFNSLLLALKNQRVTEWTNKNP